MNEKFLFYDTLSACHETMYTYVENIIDVSKKDQKASD